MPSETDPFDQLVDGSEPDLYQELENEQMPEEVRELLEKYKLSTTSYNCLLEEISPDEEGDASQGDYIKVFSRSYPGNDWIACNYGPGHYRLTFTWKGQSLSGEKGKSYTARIPIVISEKFRDIYADYQYKKKVERAKKRREDLRKVEEEQIIEDTVSGVSRDRGKTIDPAEAGRKYVEDLVASSRALGLTGGPKTDWGDMVKAFAPLAVPLITMLQSKAQAQNEQFNKLLMLMMSNSQESSNKMVELVTQQQRPTTGSDMMNEMKTMIMSALDIKSAIHGEKESVVDKVFKLVEGVAPLVLQMASTPAPVRENTPAYQAAQSYIDSSEEFSSVLGDEGQLAQLVNKLDERYGTASTDDILSVAKRTRPESTIENYKKFGGGEPNDIEKDTPN